MCIRDRLQGLKILMYFVSLHLKVLDRHKTVSYTHLDVYKRQVTARSGTEYKASEIGKGYTLAHIDHINYRIVCEKYTVDCNETYGSF